VKSYFDDDLVKGCYPECGKREVGGIETACDMGGEGNKDSEILIRM